MNEKPDYITVQFMLIIMAYALITICLCGGLVAALKFWGVMLLIALTGESVDRCARVHRRPTL